MYSHTNVVIGPLLPLVIGHKIPEKGCFLGKLSWTMSYPCYNC